MNQERKRIATEIINSESIENNKLNNFGIEYYPGDKETEIGGIYIKSKLNPSQITELINSGFKLIYPSLLSNEYVENLDTLQMKEYIECLNSALIVDTKDLLSIDLAYRIMQHKFRITPFEAEKGINTNGKIFINLNLNENSITVKPVWYHNTDYSLELQTELQQLGYRTEMDEDYAIKAYSDIPYNKTIDKYKISAICKNAVKSINSIAKIIKLFFYGKEEA